MRHILLYESFRDDIDPSTRDLFGLTSTFTIDYPVGISVTYTGPSEDEAEVRRITDKTGSVASDIVDALEKIGWKEEGEFRIYDPYYSFRGSFRNWRRANHLVGNLKRSAEYAALEKMKEDPDAGDEEKQEFYKEHIRDAIADPATVERFREIGYTIHHPYPYDEEDETY